ncbi:flagellar biosynthesis anti-sigma factor FlgM [Paenibacillus ginsengarvi]|uniref:Flagellar biosynthesis anti-sigma factor FlgM n=1 Tax=Paenibacillus ginsengarvi TaxID=400777 RepID=A0A3B0C315_9BACL|nr:flagellar biosynthesis anti-sigma factor FlgM [Paenibacillus ginsengarvi]RKN78874.1 flagellar biosynthesis anti-sigma factor FlgM [Paenibacillus ginsengarvi]
MNIGGVNRVGGTNPYARHDAKLAELKGKREKQKDEVQISAEAKELLVAKGTDAELRSRKLQELQTSVRSGTYHVDAGQIAEKLYPFIK